MNPTYAHILTGTGELVSYQTQLMLLLKIYAHICIIAN